MTLRAISDYSSAKFDEHTHDLRGSTLHLRDSNEKARVEDLIVDEGGGVRYLDAKFSFGHRLVPVGYVRSLPNSGMLTTRGIGAAELKGAPAYEPGRSKLEQVEEKLHSYYDSHDDSDSTYSGPEYRGTGWRSGEDRKVDFVEKLHDYKVADHSQDPRGWRVIDENQKEVGKVDHLVGDTKSMKVTHLVLKLDSSLAKDERYTMIPVGYADLEGRRQTVVMRGIDQAMLLSLPVYSEDKLRGSLVGDTRAALRNRSSEKRYSSPRYSDDALSRHEEDLRVQRAEEELLVGKRALEGAVHVKKTVDKEQVSERVQLRDDSVEVERHAATSADTKATIGEDEIRIPVVKEEAVVMKQPVVKEVLVVKRHRGTRNEQVQDSVRKERVEVEREGAARQGNR